MPRICPRPCGRLATAAVFISVGVVQFIAGLILLRSKYVFLLAGPDFWTSGSNVAVGCLLGVSASVWKRSRKRKSVKDTARRNILLALFLSALLINITTVGILVMSEGNTVLSIRFESDGIYRNTTFVSEILAYAYTTSVCSPIICIVVSIVAMSGSCCRELETKASMEVKSPKKNFEKERSQSFQWVYTPEIIALAKKKAHQVFISSSESSSDESSEETTSRQTYKNSVEDLQRVLHRMAEGKRNRLLNDSTLMLRQLDARRKSKYGSLVQDNSYMGPILSRTKETTLSEVNCPADDSVNKGESFHSTNSRIYRNSISYDGNTSRVSYDDVILEPVVPQRRRQPNKQHTTEEKFNYFDDSSPQLDVRNSNIEFRSFQENLQTGYEIGAGRISLEDARPKSEYMAEVHTVGENKRNDLSSFKRNSAISPKSERSVMEDLKFQNIFKVIESESPTFNDCFSPNGSDFGPDSFDLSRTSSWAGDVVPIKVSNSSAARLSQKLIPVPSPILPDNQQINLPRRSQRTVESICAEDSTCHVLKGKRENPNFRENAKVRYKENFAEYPKVGQQSTKKYDLARVVTMTSISEEPNVEIRQSTAKVKTATFPRNIADISNNPKTKVLTTVYSEPQKETDYFCSNSKAESTPKEKQSISYKSLKRMWSSNSMRDMNIQEHVVDEDSLIGLSEEELIARQNRIRSIRKAVQQRIKGGTMAP